MNVLRQIAGIAIVACMVAPVWAQTPVAPARRARPVKPKPTQVIVRDVSGAPIQGVQVTVSGGAAEELETNDQGVVPVTLGPGSYRLRFEHDSFITLERDVTIRTAAPAEIAVALNRAPPPPEPPPPAPAPEPARPTAVPAGPPVSISIPDFVDRSFVGREPIKESVLSCMPDATARLIQLREPVGEHTHTEMDEVLYVVAGDGAIRIGSQVMSVSPGSMAAIPRGIPHAIERRGRNPLIMLSTLAGAPCPVGTAGAAAKK